jgi:hypothetical protein
MFGEAKSMLLCQGGDNLGSLLSPGRARTSANVIDQDRPEFICTVSLIGNEYPARAFARPVFIVGADGLKIE